jgi:hypothetical protein
MQLAGIPGVVRTRKLWLPTSWRSVKLASWRSAALGLAAALAATRVAWNLAHPHDLFLDSWVLVHVLKVLDGEVEPLPRSALTLQYPLAYLPFVPIAKVVGPLTTVKVVYAIAASLAAIPAFLLVRRGPLPIAGALALLFIPDVVAKTLTGTPQGLAFPLFLLALYFAIRRRRLAFVTAATSVLLTHHLTGLVTMVTYYSVLVLPEVREQGFFRREWPYLAYFSAWPLWWVWTFSNIDQSYLAPMLLVLLVAIGLPLAAAAYIAAPRIRAAVDRAAPRVEAIPPPLLIALTLAFAAVAWVLAGAVVDSPGITSSAIANRTVVAVYGAVLVLGFAAAVARRDVALSSLVLVLLALGAATVVTGCQRVFDGLRLADFAAVAGLVALFAPRLAAPRLSAPRLAAGPAPGSTSGLAAGVSARWLSKPLLVGIALALIAASAIRMQSSYERLFAHTAGEASAARWVSANLPAGSSIATDTKMSLLALGAGDRNATFEGTWWLYSGRPIAPYISALNRSPFFADRPIEYVLLAKYMFERGAEVAWFVPAKVAGPGLTEQLDLLGSTVYSLDGITIWRLDPAAVSAAAMRSSVTVSFTEGLPVSRLALFGGLCR